MLTIEPEKRAVIYHGTPITPNAAFEAVMPNRAACISFYRPDQVELAERLCPDIMYDNGAFSFWQAALRGGKEWAEDRNWSDYYEWLEPRLIEGRWAVIPDSPGAPSQINDGLLNDWPFDQWGAPLWHMDGSIDRLARLCDRFERVCFGWVGRFDESAGKIADDEQAVGCEAYHRRMDEVAAFFGNQWHNIHMMRGVAVARDYPFRQRRQHITWTERSQAGQRNGHCSGRSVERKTGLC
jgi:hypothetical protein